MNVYKSFSYRLLVIALCSFFSVTLASEYYGDELFFEEQLANYLMEHPVHENSSCHEYQIALVIAGTPDLEYRLEHGSWHDLDKYITVRGVKVTLLGVAVCMGRLDIIEKILKRSNITPEHFLNSEDRNLLHFIVRHQNLLSISPEVISLLVRYGADVSHIENGTTPLKCAYYQYHLGKAGMVNKQRAQNIIRILILAGAHGAVGNFTAAEILNQPACCTLRLLAAVSPVETIRQSLSSNNSATEVNNLGEEGFSAFHLAVIRGNQEIVSLLLELGADILQPAANGWTALEIGVRHKYVNLVRLLIEHARKHKIILKNFARFARIAIRQNDLATLELLINEVPLNIDCPAFDRLFEDVLLNGSMEVISLFIARASASSYGTVLIARGIYVLRNGLYDQSLALNAIQQDHYNTVLTLLQHETFFMPFMRTMTIATVNAYFAASQVLIGLLPEEVLVLIASYLIGRQLEIAKKK